MEERGEASNTEAQEILSAESVRKVSSSGSPPSESAACVSASLGRAVNGDGVLAEKTSLNTQRSTVVGRRRPGRNTLSPSQHRSTAGDNSEGKPWNVSSGLLSDGAASADGSPGRAVSSGGGSDGGAVLAEKTNLKAQRSTVVGRRRPGRNTLSPSQHRSTAGDNNEVSSEDISGSPFDGEASADASPGRAVSSSDSGDGEVLAEKTSLKAQSSTVVGRRRPGRNTLLPSQHRSTADGRGNSGDVSSGSPSDGVASADASPRRAVSSSDSGDGDVLAEKTNLKAQRSTVVGRRRPGRNTLTPSQLRSIASGSEDDGDSDDALEEPPPDDVAARDLTHLDSSASASTASITGETAADSKPGAFAVSACDDEPDWISEKCNTAQSPRAKTGKKSFYGVGDAVDGVGDAVDGVGDAVDGVGDGAARGGGAVTAVDSRADTKASDAPYVHRSADLAAIKEEGAERVTAVKPGAVAVDVDANFFHPDGMSDKMAVVDRDSLRALPHHNDRASADRGGGGQQFLGDSLHPEPTELIMGSTCGSVPGAYAVDGINSTHHRDDDNEGRLDDFHFSDLGLGGDMDASGLNLTASIGVGGVRMEQVDRQQPSHDIAVVATLVESSGMGSSRQEMKMDDMEELQVTQSPNGQNGGGGGSAQRSPSAVVIAVAEEMKCGVNFSDRRIRMSLCVVVLAFVALAVGLGITLGTGAGNSSQAQQLPPPRPPPDGGDGGDGGAAGGGGGISGDGESDDDSDSDPTMTPTLSPTPGPTSNPTLSLPPTFAPSPAPTSLTWDPAGDGSQFFGAGNGGRFGNVVSISGDGSTVAASFEDWQEFIELRRRMGTATTSLRGRSEDRVDRDLAVSLDVWTVRLFQQVSVSAPTTDGADTAGNSSREAGGEGLPPNFASWVDLLPPVWPFCTYWDATTSSLSGDGKALAVITVGCESIVVDVYRPFAPSLPPPPSGILGEEEGAPPEEEAVVLPPPQPVWLALQGFGEPIPEGYDTRQGVEASISDDGNVLFLANRGDGGRVDVLDIAMDGTGGRTTVSGVGHAISSSANGTVFAAATSFVPGLSIETLDNGTEVFVEGIGGIGVGVFASEPDNAFALNGDSGWMQVGPDLARSAFVQSTSMSTDGTIVAIGGSSWDEFPMALPCSSCGPDLGRVRVYRLLLSDEGGESKWELMGDVLHGDNRGDGFGASVSLSEDGLTLAVGAPGSDTYGFNGGMVRIYRYDEDDSMWVAVGPDLKPAGGGEGFGSAVALSRDGRRVAVGAPDNRNGGDSAGSVSVFDLNVG